MIQREVKANLSGVPIKILRQRVPRRKSSHFSMNALL